MMNIYSSTESDTRTMSWQLSSRQVFAAGIVEKCDYGYPRIILLHPGVDRNGNEAFNHEAISNLFWLTCPYLNEKIHDLENRGYIEKIAAFINSDQELSSLMNSSQAKFYYLRKEVYRRYFGTAVPGDRLQLFQAGIAGARDHASIKCLHAHFCHYRVCAENVTGLIVHRLLDNMINCEDARCRNARR